MTPPKYEIYVPITLHRDSKINVKDVQHMRNHDATVQRHLREVICQSLNPDLPPKEEGKNFTKAVEFDIGTVEITPKPSLRSKAS